VVQIARIIITYYKYLLALRFELRSTPNFDILRDIGRKAPINLRTTIWRPQWG